MAATVSFAAMAAEQCDGEFVGENSHTMWVARPAPEQSLREKFEQSCVESTHVRALFVKRPAAVAVGRDAKGPTVQGARHDILCEQGIRT